MKVSWPKGLKPIFLGPLLLLIALMKLLEKVGLNIRRLGEGKKKVSVIGRLKEVKVAVVHVALFVVAQMEETQSQYLLPTSFRNAQSSATLCNKKVTLYETSFNHIYTMRFVGNRKCLAIVK